MNRIGSVAWVALALALAFPADGSSYDRSVTIQWQQPDSLATGFVAQIGTASGVYSQSLDLGAVTPDATGLYSASLILDASTTYYVTLMAYDAGGDSPPSNEIQIAAECLDTFCEDGNVCTTDACAPGGCSHTPVPDGTACDDGNPRTSNDQCVSGTCVGTKIKGRRK